MRLTTTSVTVALLALLAIGQAGLRKGAKILQWFGVLNLEHRNDPRVKP